MEQEIWKTAQYIFDSDGHTEVFPDYEVSSLGRVRSLKRNGKAKELKQITRKGSDGNIMYTISLCKDDKHYVLFVHRLVLSSFDFKSFQPGDVCNHKKERTQTSCINKLSNLEWCTTKQNTSTEHCRKLQSENQLNDPTKSKRVIVKDLNTGTVTEYPSAIDADRTLGIPIRTVSRCITGYNGFYKKMNLQFSYID